MDSKNRVTFQQRNPKTHAEHKREVFWQITIPLIVGVLLILAAVGAIIFSAIQPVTDVERWAGVSLIWLILPALFFALLFLAVLAGLIFGVSFLIRKIPHIALTIQLYIEQARDKITQVLDKSTKPIIRINSLWAAIRYATERGRKPSRN